MPVLPFRVVDANEAAQFRTITAGRDSRINPTRIEAGPLAGRFAFSDNVMYDKAYEDIIDLIRVAAPDITYIDTDVAWPPVQDTGD